MILHGPLILTTTTVKIALLKKHARTTILLNRYKYVSRSSPPEIEVFGLWFNLLSIREIRHAEEPGMVPVQAWR